MKETRFFYVPDAATETEMTMDEALHALRVLPVSYTHLTLPTTVPV